MSSVFQLYGRPLAEDTPLPPLMIVGSLPSYEPGNSYEGRLSVLNAIGKCTAELVESSLPPGAYVFMDNFTHEVVLAWPTYTPPTTEASTVPNGDFEAGDDGSWRKGAGWSIVAGDAETGTYSGVFSNQRGVSVLESARVPYSGETITASARFQQGASSKGNLVGRVVLLWCDADGNAIPGGEGVSFTGGNLITSGSHGEWQTSSVTAQSSRAEVKTVAVGFSAERKKQNRLARVDNFVWNHKYQVGTDDQIDYTVTIKVTDSANRVAYWTGSLVYKSTFAKSQRYPVTVFDNFQMSAFFVDASTKESYVHYDIGIENMSVSAFFTSASTRVPYTLLTQEPEALAISPFFTSASTKAVQINYNSGIENLSITANFVSASTKQALVTNTIPVEAISVTAFFTGASTS